MKKLQIAMVEDDACDRKWLSDRLEEYCRSRHINHILSAYASGEEFISALQTGWFDIVLMDIYMSGINGIEAARVLRAKDQDCKLIFLTVSTDFMPQGFSLNSAHYLLKPVRDEDFLQAMENCRIRRKCQVPFLDLTSGKQSIRLNTTDILYIDVMERNAAVHTKSGVLLAGRSFQAAADLLLKDERFLLCNKGILVNMDFISCLEDKDFVLVTGQRLPIAPRRRAKLAACYQNYIFGSLEG